MWQVGAWWWRVGLEGRVRGFWGEGGGEVEGIDSFFESPKEFATNVKEHIPF